MITQKDVFTKNDVLVVGAGLAGLTAVWQLATQQKKVRLISKGLGRYTLAQWLH